MLLHPDLITQEIVDARNSINKEAEIFFATSTKYLEEWLNESILKVNGNPRKKFKDGFDSLIAEKIESSNIPLQIYVTYGHCSISVELKTYIHHPQRQGVEYFKAAFIAGFHRNGIMQSANENCSFKTDFMKDQILSLLKEKNELRDRLSTVESTLMSFAV